jgi:branched-chain amino acid aminotransferase
MLYFYSMFFVLYDDQLISADTPIIKSGNRGLRYGDGLFETMKCVDGRIHLLPYHFERLWQGALALQMEFPRLFTPKYVEEQIFRLLHKNGHLSFSRIRISLFRGQGGLYDPEHHHPQLLIESWPLSDAYRSLNNNGLHLCLYDQARKSPDAFSQFKHNNFLPYLMGAIEAKKQRCNDAIIINSHGYVCDTTIANLFIIKDNIISTPPLEDGGVAGIMRKLLMEHLPKLGYETKEQSLLPADIANADEVFLSNALFGIRWAGRYNDATYTNIAIQKIYGELRQTSPVLFC